jgi:hypothetical protein
MGGPDLMPGERPVSSHLANLAIRRDEYGLGPFPVAGAILADNESIGGKLHLTSRRLVFAAHSVNRLKGSLTIFLPAVVSVGFTRVLLRRHIAVATENRTYRFLVWGPDAVAAAIERARQALSPADVAELRSWLTGGNQDLELNRTANAIAEVARLGLALHRGGGLLSGLSAQEALNWLAGRQNP